MANKVFIKSKFNVFGVLPPQLVIKGADSHFYRIGLSLFESRTKIKRKLFNKPIIIAIITAINFIKHLILLLETYVGTTDNRLIIGDLDYLTQSMGVMNIGYCFVSAITVGSQLINVYNKWKGIKPDLKVFEMLAALHLLRVLVSQTRSRY